MSAHSLSRIPGFSLFDGDILAEQSRVCGALRQFNDKLRVVQNRTLELPEHARLPNQILRQLENSIPEDAPDLSGLLIMASQHSSARNFLLSCLRKLFTESLPANCVYGKIKLGEAVDRPVVQRIMTPRVVIDLQQHMTHGWLVASAYQTLNAVWSEMASAVTELAGQQPEICIHPLQIYVIANAPQLEVFGALLVATEAGALEPTKKVSKLVLSTSCI